jgi:hypothetical protein
MEMGLIHPPVGLNIFVIKNIAPDIPLKDIIWGTLPFVILMAVAILLLHHAEPDEVEPGFLERRQDDRCRHQDDRDRRQEEAERDHHLTGGGPGHRRDAALALGPARHDPGPGDRARLLPAAGLDVITTPNQTRSNPASLSGGRMIGAVIRMIETGGRKTPT